MVSHMGVAEMDRRPFSPIPSSTSRLSYWNGYDSTTVYPYLLPGLLKIPVCINPCSVNRYHKTLVALEDMSSHVDYQ